MSLFGNTAYPKIVVSGSGTVYDLEESKVEKDYQNDLLTHQAINGKTTYILKGNYYDFNITLSLYKYSDPKTMFSNLYNLYMNQTKVQYYIHADGYPIKDKDNNVVWFRITDFKPYELQEEQSLYDEDMIQLTFSSTDYVDISKSLM